MSAIEHYRAPPPDAGAAATALAYPPERTKGVGNLVRAAVGLGLGVPVAVAASAIHIAVTAVMLAAVAGWVALGAWREVVAGRVRLTVERGVVAVPMGPGAPPVRARLEDLLNVEIEHESSPVRAAAGHATGAALAVGASDAGARIAFVLDDGAGGRRVRPSEEYVPYARCVDWLGRVRVFLRANGWVPADERK